MTRSQYGPTIVAIPGATSGTIDSEKSPVVVSRTPGGTPETNLQTLAGAAITQPDPDDVTGRAAWLGPDGYAGAMWVQDPGDPSVWWEVLPVGIADRVGGVVTVNGHTGATITLTADDLGDGTLKVMMTLGERNRLANMQDNATRNSSDTALLAPRPSNQVLTDMDLSDPTKVDGMAPRWDQTLGKFVPQDDPAAPGASAISIFDVTEMQNIASADVPDGSLMVWRKVDNTILFNSGILGILPLPQGATVPANTVRCAIGRTAATTLIKQHIIEGAAGSTVDSTVAQASPMNFSGMVGPNRTFTATPTPLRGTTCIKVTQGTQGVFYDANLGVDVLVARRRIRFTDAVGIVNFAEFRDDPGTGAVGTGPSLCALQRDFATGNIKMKDGAGATKFTLPINALVDTWWIIEYKCVAAGFQSLRWFDASDNLVYEALDKVSTVGSVVDESRGGPYGANLGTAYIFDDSAIGADWIGTAA